ncbi:Zn(II)2Cys6 transcription factor [Aspergillus mulundensis]|uniref:Putative Zn(II)2Cys6 transcription factor n=1 Tax=Aspergillus mulundensis TaxID=1810919 RepID=A0A3D8RXW1_9EURO|nr:putative Zn(II)2Cys6 transcription factor [Aspergillus mulundensis]RDW78846.1 putative Zn(II)2Cys6 transcription factor [Aspergillus mulundensis]
MDSEQLQQKIRSRRTHRKSRLGCGNCKKRRVKCDEKKPMCSNCVQHSIDCDFQFPASSSPSEGSTPPQTRRFKFRPSKYQSQTSSPAPEQASSNSRSIGVQCDSSPTIDFKGGPGEGISLPDLSLFHHFTTSTYCTLAAEEAYPVWQIHVPRWGFSFPSIMHLLITLSALHLAHLNPAKQAEYIHEADEHFTFGVRSVTSVLALDTLDSTNCQQIYIAAVMICFAYFARGPRDGEYLVFNAKGKSEWLVLLHGVRTILSQKQPEIFTGVLAPEKEKQNMDILNPELDTELSRHIHRLQEVKAMVSVEIQADSDLYVQVVDDLIGCFDGAYQKRKAGIVPQDLMPFTVGWTFRLPEMMIDRLEGREPVALVILAHWAILLRYMGDVWFMRGWDQHIILGIRACLPPAYHAWIEWPEEVIASEQ